ncbi:MAG TPA: LysR family transcriptional regulator [Polyangiaceae bacterium]|nr:LysR family transcriptional regulator [Polyangiaceae bacterium]
MKRIDDREHGRAPRPSLRLSDSAAAISPRPQLEVRDLELMIALSMAGSTASAALGLHITQSAVSRALAQVEERLGVALFERRARGLSPTAAGSRLIEGARPILQQLHELERAVAAPAREPLRLRLVCECYTAYRWLPSVLAKLRERWPDLQVALVTDHTVDPAQGLDAGEIDVALLTTAELPRGRGLREQPLFADEVVFVMAPEHELARGRHVTARQLEQAQLITGDTPPGEARWFMRAAFGRRRPRLKFMHFPLTEAVLDAARAGMGVAVLSEWMANGYLDRGDLVVRRLAARPLRRPWRIAYRDELSHVAERLKGALCSAVPRLRDAV